MSNALTGQAETPSTEPNCFIKELEECPVYRLWSWSLIFQEPFVQFQMPRTKSAKKWTVLNEWIKEKLESQYVQKHFPFM